MFIVKRLPYSIRIIVVTYLNSDGVFMFTLHVVDMLGDAGHLQQRVLRFTRCTFLHDILKTRHNLRLVKVNILMRCKAHINLYLAA